MATQTTDWRRELKDYTEQELSDIYKIVGGLVLVGLGVLLGYILFADHDGYQTNLFTELLSFCITVTVLNTLAEIRAHRELKARLIREMGASDSGIAWRAVNELRAHNWLIDGSLQGVDLRNAKLIWPEESAIGGDLGLKRADLERSLLMCVNLISAPMWYIRLAHAKMWKANLRWAGLYRADLSNADLRDANLEEANLEHAKLQGAILRSANLKGAILMRAEFSRSTELPDGTLWTPDTDMMRFTDPDHSDFWRSNDPRSPAYRGNDDRGGE